MNIMKRIIFTDLDGTLLHPKSYSFQEAMPALESIREQGIPLVLCSSKTRPELEVYRKRLRNSDPFISENGGALYTPAGYFSFFTGSVLPEGYIVSAFGKPYQDIRKEFVRLRESLHVPVRGFGDMTVEEISSLTGLTREEAALARRREFDEPFIFEQGVDERFLEAAAERGLRWTRGRFYHLMGDHDKGRAVRLLKQWYERKHGTLITIGLGDGLNDLPLLTEVDHPILVQKEDGSFEPELEIPGLIRAQGIGPSGWNRAVLELLKN
jgi:mannosyl-3-phosphoglycerate phosphatase